MPDLPSGAGQTTFPSRSRTICLEWNFPLSFTYCDSLIAALCGLGEVCLKCGDDLIDLCDCLFHCCSSLFDVDVPVFCRDVPERTVTFDVVGIEVFRLASPEEAALPADGAVAETLELFADEFKSLLPCRCLYVRRHHSSRIISTQR